MSAPRLADQFGDLARQAHAARLGMWVFLASELLLFGGLFALYAAYRAMYVADFTAAAAHNDAVIGTTNTAVLLTSSLTVALAVHAARNGRRRATTRWLVVSFSLGLVFLVLKGTEYAHHFAEGIRPGHSFSAHDVDTFGGRTFFALYYTLTGLHALHVIGGMTVLGMVAWRAHRGVYSPAHHLPVELGGLYWHLVDIVWIFLWPLLYLVR